VGKIILSCSGLLLWFERGVRSQENNGELRIKENKRELRVSWLKK